MKQISLGLSQLIAIAWVWQQEITPKYLPTWNEIRAKCGTIRRPEIHVEAYNSLLDQIFSDTKEIKCTKAAMHLFANTSMYVLMPFTSGETFVKGFRDTPNLLTAKKQIMKPSDSDLTEARSIIRTLLSIDSHGKPVYESMTSGSTCMVFTASK